MEEVETLIKQINTLKHFGHFSLDIYYNDIDDTFVVKIQNIITNKKQYPTKHFRNKKLIDSLLDSYNYLKSILK